MNIDYYRRKRFINSFIDEYKGISYREEEGCNIPHTDGSSIVMPVYKPDFTEQDNTKWMSSLIHECYHNLPSNRADFSVIKAEKINMNSPFGFIHNIVVDHNIEHKEWGKLPGADRYLENSNDSIFSTLNKKKLEQFEPIVQAVLAFDIICRSEWCTPTDYNITSHICDEANDMLTKLLDDEDICIDYLTGREGGLPNLELTRRIIKQATDEQTQEEMEQQAQGQGQGESEEGEGEGKGQAQGKQTIDYDELSKHSGKHLSPNEKGCDVTINYKDSDFISSGEYTVPKTKIVRPVPASEGSMMPYSRTSEVRDALNFTLSTKIRNYLKALSQAKYRGGKKRGKINKRSIASVSAGNERIFRTREVAPVLDTAVSLLIDCSGSMCGDKYTHAVAATCMMSDTLTKLSVPHEILGFQYAYSNTIYEHKGYGESKDTDAIMDSMLSDDVQMCCNSDGDAINVAHDRLIRQKQKRKVLVVLSDGQPAGPYGSCEYTVKVIKEIEHKSPVDLIGIGIEDTTVTRLYKNNTVIRNCSMLEDKLINVLKEVMTQ